MNWIIFAVGAPLFWAIANHLDKYLLSKYVKGGGIGSLLVVSSIYAIFVLPVIFFLNAEQILSIAKIDLLILIAVGILNTLGVLFYLYALNEDEASIVTPLLQLIPIVAYIFGYFILGEKLPASIILPCLSIILGAMILSSKFKGGKITIKAKMIAFMVASSICFALHGVLFKFAAIGEVFWVSVFWEYFGILLCGIFFLIFVKSYRDEFIKLVKENGKSVLALNFTNETLVLIGNVLTAFAFTLAPVSIVISVAGFQPLFVLIIGILITIFLPKISEEDISKKGLIPKFIGIALIIAGGIFLNQ